MMIEEEKKKIKEEIEKYKEFAADMIGGYLLKQIEVNPKCAEKIVSGAKTIKGAYEAIKSEARKKAKSGCYCFEGEKGYKDTIAIINKYYDFEGVQTEIKVEEVTAPIEVKETPKEKAKFEVSIEDLL